MKRATIKGRTCGWPGVAEVFVSEDGKTYHCPHCMSKETCSFSMFDHVAYKHPKLIKGESAQR